MNNPTLPCPGIGPPRRLVSIDGPTHAILRSLERRLGQDSDTVLRKALEILLLGSPAEPDYPEALSEAPTLPPPAFEWSLTEETERTLKAIAEARQITLGGALGTAVSLLVDDLSPETRERAEAAYVRV
jgi:hypothetical protein